MKCLLKYKWVKLPRNQMPSDKGIMRHWARLASRAAFRKGNASYCGYSNPVQPGMWAGGIVGVKSILGVRTRQQAFDVLDELNELGYLTYTLDKETKKLTYQITDWVLKCSGEECMDGAVYATEGYGFLCMPRNITQRLIDKDRKFGEADAWLDLWCHTTYEDYGNAFSFLAPVVQYGKYGCAVSMEILGKRWGWEKTKVWRFLHKHSDTFLMIPLPGAFGCIIYNKMYQTEKALAMPTREDVYDILAVIRASGDTTRVLGTDNERLNHMIAWWSRCAMQNRKSESDNSSENRQQDQSAQMESKCPVARFDPITRAYFSHGWNCNTCRNCIYDCLGTLIGEPGSLEPLRPAPGNAEENRTQKLAGNGEDTYGEEE